MRFLPSLAALTLVTTSIAPRIADACGSYGSRRPPTLMLVSTHWAHDMEGTQRSFVVFPAKATVDKSESWIRLAPMTYDNAEIIDRGRDIAPRTFTLVGDGGTKVVASTRHVVLAKSYSVDFEAHDAMEIGHASKDDFVVAIVGDASSSTWHTLASAGLDENVSYGDDGTTSEIRDGRYSLGTFRGYALGVLVHRGVRYVVVKDGASARAYHI